MPDPGVVRAFAPPGTGRHAVVAWARRHARRTGARIEVLVDPDLDPEAPPARATGTRAGPIALVGGLLEHVWALFGAPPSLAERLGRASAGARMLVVPQSLPEVDVLVDTAYEPVTVVPTDPPHPQGAVVLALAHRTTDETIEAAFDAAERRGVPVHVLRIRDPDRWTRVGTEDEDGRVDEERRDCADRLSAWRVTHPSVPLEVRVGDGDPTVELIGSTCDARLLVVGRSARGRVLGAVAPSPVARTVRSARCPVLVVPPPGPPRRSWWPRA
ncbi:universal stress protein [Actinomycetospora chibensis]|uniref:Universal stress protein n=1 Tax=Actinomycetospora chibensis TaxID=663606 RepID=A0ABV9RC21_9PSEU|nr:universal stress protein [Actinomycetospora chibensis]MDD7922193.1 universal stress protein [Actinomycetospora chibensis]